MPSNPELLDLVVSIVSAHVAHNAVPSEALPGVIRSVFATLNGLGTEAPAVEKPEPAVPVKRSVFPDYIICLEDGKKLKMLKRHLSAAYGMTPDEYRARWDLPRDYPMVASTYAAQRSALAKEIGLGRKPEPSEARPAPSPRRVAEGVRGGRARQKEAGAQ